MLEAIAESIRRLNELIGTTVSWLALGMVLLTFFNVIQRYFLSSGSPWEQELVRFMHAIAFLAAAGYTLKHDEHVRIDVFYQRFSTRIKVWIDIAGTLLLLFPTTLAIFYFSWNYVLYSWELLESSSEFRGMPGVFILKSFIWFFSASLMLQGVANIIDGIKYMKLNNGER